MTSESWSGAVNGAVSFTYDSLFRVASQSVSGGNAVDLDYDADGLLKTVGMMTVERDDSTGAAIGTSLGDVTTLWEHGDYGEPLVGAALLGQDTLWRAVYGRDAVGRITGISENMLGTVSTRGYAYSDTGFLSVVSENGAVVERYGYDGNGNRTRFDAPGYGVDAEYDDQDRLTQYGDTLYAYTAAGELAERVVGTDTTRYAYDPLGNLVEVVLPSGDTIAYVIDGRSRRVARQVNGVVAHRWLYQDQLEPVAEVDSTGNPVARYVYGTRAHVPDYVVKGDSTYRIVADHLGSVRLVVNVASGWVAQRLEYDGYGRVLEDTNPGFQCFGYAGGLWDAAAGHARFGARDYDPQTGRWLSRDPVGFRGGSLNLHQYVMNAPTDATDPSGLLSKEAAMWGVPPKMPSWPDPRRGAATEAAAGSTMSPRYDNAWLHALAGEYARRWYGIIVARCLNEVKEFYEDRYLDRQGQLETVQDYWNFEMGVQGRHRSSDGRPDSTHLIPDPQPPAGRGR
jgi:RHS repeat-associated protein